MEIERKFLIKELPGDLDNYPCHKIEQAYLNTNPVVRIRRQDDTYILTYKGEGHMVREEYNLPLNETSYCHLKEKADGIVLSKTRYLLPLDGGLTIELDVFRLPMRGFTWQKWSFRMWSQPIPSHRPAGSVRKSLFHPDTTTVPSQQEKTGRSDAGLSAVRSLFTEAFHDFVPGILPALLNLLFQCLFPFSCFLQSLSICPWNLIEQLSPKPQKCITAVQQPYADFKNIVHMRPLLSRLSSMHALFCLFLYFNSSLHFLQ